MVKNENWPKLLKDLDWPKLKFGKTWQKVDKNEKYELKNRKSLQIMIIEPYDKS